MTKDQCQAIILAIQTGCEYVARASFELGPGRIMTDSPATVLSALTTSFETAISTIIGNIPDDQVDDG